MARFVNIRHAGLTDVGVKRSHNQDALASQPATDPQGFLKQGHVFIVADGMGGHAVGEKASAMAARDIPLAFKKHVVHQGVAASIRLAFREANSGIFAIGQNNPEFKGLGTTSTAIFVRDEGVWIGHVGDSRTYRIRGNKVQQLTFDDSWVWEVARRQGLDPDELGDFKRNVIIRSLGPDSEVEADIEGPHPLVDGDQYLMCSDGLSNVVTPDEVGAIASTFPPEEACKHLIALANLRGGPDNITAMIVQIRETMTGGFLGRVKQALGKVFSSLLPNIPWPFIALAAGVLLCWVCLVFCCENIEDGAVLAFLVATMIILAGLVGLYQQLRARTEAAGLVSNEAPTELRVYKEYPFEFAKPLVDRFTELQASLKESMKDKDFGIDQSVLDKANEEVEACITRNDWPAAFKMRFLSLMYLAEALHKSRNKGEEFRPNY